MDRRRLLLIPAVIVLGALVAVLALGPSLGGLELPWWLVFPAVIVMLLMPLAAAVGARATAAFRPAHVRKLRDGTFEFHPANEPRPDLRIQATDGMHAEPPGRRVSRTARVEIPDGAPERQVARAIAAATRKATRALPGRGKVTVRAQEADLPGPTSRIRAHLLVEGVGADEAWADAAQRAFEAEVARRLR